MSWASWRFHGGCCLALASAAVTEASQAAGSITSSLPDVVRRAIGDTRELTEDPNFLTISWQSRAGQCMAVVEQATVKSIQLSDCSNDPFHFFAAPSAGSTGGVKWVLDLELCVEASRDVGVVLSPCNEGDERQQFALSADGRLIQIAQTPDLCLGVRDSGDEVVLLPCSIEGAGLVQSGIPQADPGPALEQPSISQADPDPAAAIAATATAAAGAAAGAGAAVGAAAAAATGLVQSSIPQAALDADPDLNPDPSQPLDDPVVGPCDPTFQRPSSPLHAGDHNGVLLGDVCIPSQKQHHVLVIGDWGGVGVPPKPADARTKLFGQKHRRFVSGVDDCAQQRVARVFNLRAASSDPDYIINVGDNFYWGGVDIQCGAPPFNVQDTTGQWQHIFEDIYRGPGVDGKPWLGILGNHDYGGYQFTGGWDQVIGYTWTVEPPSTGRWLTPAQFWASRVRYPDSAFSVDYFFLDSNVFDVMPPDDFKMSLHNICSREHNPSGASCGPQGPTSVNACPDWFNQLWSDQADWLEGQAASSVASWQVLVTHFPPTWRPEFFEDISRRHGIDMIISGHVHSQELSFLEDGTRSTLQVISGGGGGITSEAPPAEDGSDDQYGFMDITLSREEIKVEAISHGGHLRKVLCAEPRPAEGKSRPSPLSGPSMCQGVELGLIGELADGTAELQPQFV